MSDDIQIRANIQALAEQIRNLVQVGIIKDIDYKKSRVKVAFDKDFISDWLAWAEGLAGKTHTWTPPKIGDQAIVLSLGGNLKRGVIIGYLNQNKHPQISTDGDLQKVLFANGSSVEVHEANNTMNIQCKGTTLNIKADTINMSASSGDIKINGVSLVNHTHAQNGGDHFGGDADTSTANKA